MKRVILTGIMFGTMLMSSSCVWEDMSDCVTDVLDYNVRLTVKTDYEQSRGPADREWYDGQINSVTVYAFDENDMFVASWTGGAYQIGQEYVVPMNLEGGNYRFVAWTNCGGFYSPSHTEEELEGLSYNDLTMNLNVDDNETLRETIPHRHHGLLNAAIIDGIENRHTIVVSPHTYMVNFTVRGLSGGEYEMDITDRNSRHTFERDYVPVDRLYHHRRALAPSASDLTASMRLLQIGDDTQTTFSVLNSADEDTPLYTTDLLATIQTKYELTDAELADMLEDVYKYDITIIFGAGGGGGLAVTVEVKAWGYKDNSGNL